MDIVIFGQKYLLSHFLEKVSGNITSKKHKRTGNKTTIFFMRVLSILLQSLRSIKVILKFLPKISWIY